MCGLHRVQDIKDIVGRICQDEPRILDVCRDHDDRKDHVKEECQCEERQNRRRTGLLHHGTDQETDPRTPDLIASTSRASHHIALSQLRGHFSTRLSQLRDQLLHLTTLLELELDFSKTVEELKAADDENKARLVALTETPKAEPRDISFGSLDDLNISDDSFTSLIANVGEKGVSESKSLVDLDFGDMDDDWA